MKNHKYRFRTNFNWSHILKFCEDDVIIVTSSVHKKWSVSAVFCPLFYHLSSFKHHFKLRDTQNEHVQQ